MTNAYTPQDKPQRRKGAWIRPVATTLLLIAFIGGTFLFMYMNLNKSDDVSASSTVNAFVKYIQKGEADNARALVAPRDVAAGVRLTALPAQKGAFTEENYTIIGSEAYYLYTIQSQNTQKTYVRITLRQQSPKSWRVVDAVISSTAIPLKPL